MVYKERSTSEFNRESGLTILRVILQTGGPSVTGFHIGPNPFFFNRLFICLFYTRGLTVEVTTKYYKPLVHPKWFDSFF